MTTRRRKHSKHKRAKQRKMELRKANAVQVRSRDISQEWVGGKSKTELSKAV